MSVERWWNDIDRGKLKYWERNLYQCHLVNHESDMICLRIEPELLR